MFFIQLSLLGSRNFGFFCHIIETVPRVSWLARRGFRSYENGWVWFRHREIRQIIMFLTSLVRCGGRQFQIIECLRIQTVGSWPPINLNVAIIGLLLMAANFILCNFFLRFFETTCTLIWPPILLYKWCCANCSALLQTSLSLWLFYLEFFLEVCLFLFGWPPIS